jgi:hypothetical protein
MFEMLIPYALAAWIAGFIAFGELTSRHLVLSLPHGVRSGAVWAYLLVNAGAGITGTALVQAFAPGLGPFASSFIGAFGALMFLRSSVMSVQSGTIEVPIGPAGILSLLLSTADRARSEFRRGGRRTRASPAIHAVRAHRRIASPLLAGAQHAASWRDRNP